MTIQNNRFNTRGKFNYRELDMNHGIEIIYDKLYKKYIHSFSDKSKLEIIYDNLYTPCVGMFKNDLIEEVATEWEKLVKDYVISRRFYFSDKYNFGDKYNHQNMNLPDCPNWYLLHINPAFPKVINFVIEDYGGQIIKTNSRWNMLAWCGITHKFGRCNLIYFVDLRVKV